MKKLIDIPEKNDVLQKLKIKAIKAGTNLKNYIEDLLIADTEKE